MGFRKDMVWGAATAAYQIEGAAYEDGKGLNIWDVYAKEPGYVKDQHTGDIACDHYHRFKEDVALMKEVGLKAYRFSISWPRILPEGTGAINEKGLQFYSDLVDALLEAGITPYVTLYHWDLPYTLHQKGGWLNSDMVNWFADYTKVVVDRLSDRVSHWLTLNEPQCFVVLGYQDGEHAPFMHLSRRDVLQVAHNALLTHGQAVKVIRQYAKIPPKVGFAPVGCVSFPKDPENQALVEATRHKMFRTDMDRLFNAAWWSDPVFLGHYPEDGVKYFADDMPKICPGDMDLIAQPLDFYGVNIYNGEPYTFDNEGNLIHAGHPLAHPTTSMGWYVDKESMYWGVRYLYERYKMPIIITENGVANNDWVMNDGKIHDPQRIDFLQQYIGALEKATDDGVQVIGYFQWSFMDNYEWAEGYYKRFGLVHVDYATQKRTLKDSAYWYKGFIESQSFQK